MTRKTKYELLLEVRQYCKMNNMSKTLCKMSYNDLKDELVFQKALLAKSVQVKERGGHQGPREIKLIQNEDGILVPIAPTPHLTKPIVKRPVGRPRKDAKPPEEVITKPPEAPVFRLETLGADSDSDEEEKTITHVPPISSTRCTCLTCPVHNSTKRI